MSGSEFWVFAASVQITTPVKDTCASADFRETVAFFKIRGGLLLGGSEEADNQCCDSVGRRCLTAQVSKLQNKLQKAGVVWEASIWNKLWAVYCDKMSFVQFWNDSKLFVKFSPELFSYVKSQTSLLEPLERLDPQVCNQSLLFLLNSSKFWLKAYKLYKVLQKLC